MNQYEMIVTIVAIIAASAVLITFLCLRLRPVEEPGAEALVEEMRAMKDRLATLERLAVEHDNSLAREIDSLRASAPPGAAAPRSREKEIQ